MAVIAGATAAALEAQRRRKEEEARQAAEAAQEAARKNAAFEAERVQNYLQGKAMLDAALKNSSLSEAEKERVRAESQAKGIGAALGVLGGLMQAAQERAQRTYQKMERKMKGLYQKAYDEEPPSNAVVIPPLTTGQYVALQNWNIAAQVAAMGLTTGITTAIGFLIGIKIGGLASGLVSSVIGAMSGVMWGAYEVSCIASVQDEFDEAYQRSSDVIVWRKGWVFSVAADGGDTYIEANAPLSAMYVAVTTWMLTGKIP